jgi:site-specific DNA recombinase
MPNSSCSDPIRAVVYAAKSTEDRHGSIPTQIEDCCTMAEREGWTVIGEHQDEAFSAYHGNRGPGLAAAKQQAIDNAPCVLVARDADRFARGAGDTPGAADHLGELFWQLRRQGVELWTVRSRQLDPIRAALEGERATGESERKSQAVKAGIKRHQAKGKAWGEVALGYKIKRTVVDDSVISERVIDPESEPVVQAIFTALDESVPAGTVARKLNALGHRTRRGNEFTARTVLHIARNADYTGSGPYPKIIEPDVWQRVNAKVARPDAAAVQSRKGGRRPLADFMLRRLAFCLDCGRPMYAMTRRSGGKRTGPLFRTYQCQGRCGSRGTCNAPAVPADLAEQRVLEHLDLFVGGDLSGFIAERLAERAGERTALQNALDAEKARLAVLDGQRTKHMDEYHRLVQADDPLARYALEPVAKLDAERERQIEAIGGAEAMLAEWTGEANVDGALDFYNGVRDLVQGRIAKAEGVAEINAALHDSLTGVWLRFDGERLTAEFKLRPTGDPDLDAVIVEVFGSELKPMPGMLAEQAQMIASGSQLPDIEPTYKASTATRSSEGPRTPIADNLRQRRAPVEAIDHTRQGRPGTRSHLTRSHAPVARRREHGPVMVETSFGVGALIRRRTRTKCPALCRSISPGRLELFPAQPGPGLRASSRSTSPSLERSSNSIEKPSACTCSSGSRSTWSAPKRTNAGASSRWTPRTVRARRA